MDDFVCNLYFTQQVMDDANFFFLKQKENHKPVKQLSRMPIPLENFPLDVTKKKKNVVEGKKRQLATIITSSDLLAWLFRKTSSVDHASRRRRPIITIPAAKVITHSFTRSPYRRPHRALHVKLVSAFNLNPADDTDRVSSFQIDPATSTTSGFCKSFSLPK